MCGWSNTRGPVAWSKKDVILRKARGAKTAPPKCLYIRKDFEYTLPNLLNRVTITARTLVGFTKGHWRLVREIRETEKEVGLETWTRTKIGLQEILGITHWKNAYKMLTREHSLGEIFRLFIHILYLHFCALRVGLLVLLTHYPSVSSSTFKTRWSNIYPPPPVRPSLNTTTQIRTLQSSHKLM